MLILASASPRRRELLAAITPNFEVRTSGVDESPFAALAPEEAVQALSRAKAAPFVSPGDVVIGADTIVVLDGEILGKPKDEADAAAMLGRLSGRKHTVMTGVTIATPEKSDTFCQKTDVWFYELTKDEIAAYIKSGEPMDKAGAYGIQGRARLFVEKIDGDFYSVVGLPVGALYQRLKAFLPKRG